MTTNRVRYCPATYEAYDGEAFAICTAPAGHAGKCDLTDTMGMCFEDNCRALRGGMWGTNGHEHNH